MAPPASPRPGRALEWEWPIPPIVFWSASGLAAVVLFSVQVPIHATAYAVPVVAAFAIGLLQAGSLPIAVWHPWAGVASFLAGQVVFGLVGAADPGQPWPVSVPQLLMLCALLIVLVVRGADRAAIALWVAAVVVPLGLAFLPDRGATPDGLVANLVTSAAVSALVLGVALAVTVSRARLSAALDEERRTSAAEHERRLIAEERTRIARELHDVVAHSMSIIQVQATSAPYRLTGLDDATTAEFGEIAASARAAIADMRELLTVLRDPAAEAETAPQPTLAQLPELVASVERAGVPVELEVSPGLLDGGLAASTAYRMVQESLSNVLRHAPGAPTVVTLRRVDGDRASLDLTIRNGPPPGTSPSTPSAPTAAPIAASSLGPGHGLIGMRERARLVGGRIDSGPTADGGFEVHAVLPLVGGRPEEAS
ncbi:histidine kinase [Agromyces aurantiacus]|uniref:histidine kinase n=1 Tax=Agromyces aurantiacus TaxID=165814 RepID=A0ABV9R6C5_9MICO|nr:histidine kinase [Agromyces aurantiacus]MBM7503734.1 signal transduction histidine kinase [Agromyces aurantiacus]